MFAHGLSEIYSVMDELFKKLGVTTLGPSLEAAVAAAADNKPLTEVRRRVDDVRNALQDAARRGPQADEPKRLQAYLVGELIERAAAQYTVTLKDKALEPYLDGLGFAIAARREAAAVLPSLRKSDKQAASALENALKLAQRVYPGIKQPAKPPVSETELLVASSRARLALSAYR
jgi:cytochrome c551/c552